MPFPGVVTLFLLGKLVVRTGHHDDDDSGPEKGC